MFSNPAVPVKRRKSSTSLDELSASAKSGLPVSNQPVFVPQVAQLHPYVLAAQYADAVEAATVLDDRALCTINMDATTHREIWTLFNLLDTDKSGTITREDFVSAM